MSKLFHIGDVLSVTTGRFVTPNGMGGIYDILGYMTGADLFTHQLPRAAEVCGPVLLAQYPYLAEIEIPEKFDGDEDFDAWLLDIEARYPLVDVAPLGAGAYEHRNPLSELAEMMGGDDNIVVAALDPDEES